MEIDWEPVKNEFEPDGSVLDVYVRDCGIPGWQRFFDALRASDYDYAYTTDTVIDAAADPAAYAKQTAPLPDRAETALQDYVNIGTDLSVTVGDVLIPCHFFYTEHIECTIYQEQITGQATLEVLCNWLHFLAKATGMNAVLTPESYPSEAILRASPDGSIEHRPPKPRRWYWPFRW